MYKLNSRFIRLWFLTACLLALSILAQAQSPSSEATHKRFLVNSLSLQGFSKIEGYPLNFLELSAELNRQRENFARQLTIDQLHQIADAVTVYVRRKGFVFHTVYLPPQTMSDGRVQFELVEGRLTDIHVLNKSKIPDQRVERVFHGLLNRMLFAPDVEARVQALKAQAGVKIFAFYSRGAKAGEARLNVRVDPKKAYNVSLKLDNFGSVTSGKYRALARFHAPQLTQRFDQLSLAVLSSVDDTANVYGSISYLLPSASLKFAWDLSASNNQFELGDRFADLGLDGAATNVQAGFSYQRIFDPVRKERLRLSYFSKTSHLDAGQTPLEREKSAGVHLQWSKAKQWQGQALAGQWWAGVSGGDIVRSAGDKERFSKVDANLQLAKGIGHNGRFQTVITAVVSGQGSEVNLPSVEAFALTGAYGVRGFEPGVFSADTALLASLELGLPNVWRSKAKSGFIEPFVFADWATGSKNALGETLKSKATFAGAGVGLRFGFGQHFSGQFYGAAPLDSEDVNGSIIDGNEIWRFEVRFH